MACNADFVQFIVDQCSGAGDITVRKMMGDYCIYCSGMPASLTGMPWRLINNSFRFILTENP